MYDPQKLDPYHGIVCSISDLSEIAVYLANNEDACEPDKLTTLSYYLKRLEEVRYNLNRVKARMYYMQTTYGENLED
jgi:hypothetical protein